jgi:heterodisulfide reductase subunit C
MHETPGDSRLEMCIQCGTCGGSCPAAEEMDHTPRQIFAMIRADMKEEVLSSNMPWYCVSCYYCMVRCPQEVHIPDIMYTLKSMAVQAKHYPESTGADLSKLFSSYVEKEGRVFEFGLAALHSMRHLPVNVLDLSQMGLGLMVKGRMELLPTRIEGQSQLQAILNRADQIELENRI